jgi:hypothetical protein
MNGNEYETVAKHLRQHVCFVRSIGRYFVKQRDGVWVDMRSKKDTYDAVPGVNASIVKMWLADKTCKSPCEEYDGADYFADRTNCPQHTLNLWTPFAHPARRGEPYSDAEILRHTKTPREHLNVLCGYDAAAMVYVELWLALLLQRPDYPVRTNLIINGPQGSGKGRWTEFVEEMLGAAHCVRYDGLKDLMADFATSVRMAGKHLLVVDEAPVRDLRVVEKKLRIATGRNTTTYKPSYCVRPMDIQRRVRLILHSNCDDVMPIATDDRRFFIIQPSVDMCGDSAYFQRLDEDLDNPAIVEAYAQYLCSLDITNFHPETSRPMTPTMVRARLLSNDPFDTFFHQHLKTFKKMAAEEEHIGNRILAFVRPKDLRKLFADHVDKHGLNIPNKKKVLERDDYFISAITPSLNRLVGTPVKYVAVTREGKEKPVYMIDLPILESAIETKIKSGQLVTGGQMVVKKFGLDDVKKHVADRMEELEKGGGLYLESDDEEEEEEDRPAKRVRHDNFDDIFGS